MCSAKLQVWGPWPYRLDEVICNPHAVRPMRFDFDLLPAGDWGIRVWLSWTDAGGVDHERMNEFPKAPGPGAAWITVTDGETTTVRLTADRPGGRIGGSVIDDRNGAAISGQYEPGASLIHVLAYTSDGYLAGAGGNGCNGTYEVWLPEGRYALAAADWATGYWSDAWMPDGQPFAVPLGSDPYVSIDPASIPAGAWVTVTDGRTTEVTVRLEPGPEWREPAVGEWWPWVVETVEGEPLSAAHPWRDRSWWAGRSLTFDESTNTWPPALLLDGEPLGLHGWPEPSDRWGDGLVVVAGPPPPPGLTGTGGEPSSRPGYRIVLAAEPSGLITDLLYLEPGPGEFVAANARAPHHPGTWFAVLGKSATACVPAEGPAVRAWRLTEGRFIEADPTGISVVLDW
jgi:hypothetical protein